MSEILSRLAARARQSDLCLRPRAALRFAPRAQTQFADGETSIADGLAAALGDGLPLAGPPAARPSPPAPPGIMAEVPPPDHQPAIPRPADFAPTQSAPESLIGAKLEQIAAERGQLPRESALENNELERFQLGKAGSSQAENALAPAQRATVTAQAARIPPRQPGRALAGRGIDQRAAVPDPHSPPARALSQAEEVKPAAPACVPEIDRPAGWDAQLAPRAVTPSAVGQPVAPPGGENLAPAPFSSAPVPKPAASGERPALPAPGPAAAQIPLAQPSASGHTAAKTHWQAGARNSGPTLNQTDGEKSPRGAQEPIFTENRSRAQAHERQQIGPAGEGPAPPRQAMQGAPGPAVMTAFEPGEGAHDAAAVIATVGAKATTPVRPSVTPPSAPAPGWLPAQSEARPGPLAGSPALARPPHRAGVTLPPGRSKAAPQTPSAPPPASASSPPFLRLDANPIANLIDATQPPRTRSESVPPPARPALPSRQVTAGWRAPMLPPDHSDGRALSRSEPPLSSPRHRTGEANPAASASAEPDAISFSSPGALSAALVAALSTSPARRPDAALAPALANSPRPAVVAPAFLRGPPGSRPSADAAAPKNTIQIDIGKIEIALPRAARPARTSPAPPAAKAKPRGGSER